MKTAIIGCGNMAQIHIPYVLKIPSIALVGLCDQNEIRVKEIAMRYDLPYYTNLDQLLTNARPDILHVVTPPKSHAALAIKGLKAGCHVFVEKPLCLTVEEAKAIYQAARSAGKLVSVNHTHLWSPLVQQARQVLESGRLGRIVHIQYVMGDNFLEVVKNGYSRWALELHGGIFSDLISHPLSLILSFMPGAEVVSAHARGTSMNDLHELRVDFTAKDGWATLWMSLNQRPLEHTLQIFCTGGKISVDLRNFCVAVVPGRGLPGAVERGINTLSEVFQRVGRLAWNVFMLPLGRFDPHVGTAGAIRAFYKAIEKGKPSPVREEEAMVVAQLTTEVWNLLEKTPGALRMAVDEKGRAIEHKKVEDFAKLDKDKIPNVLVTGGTGFIGSHLVQRLTAKGQRVRVLCRTSSNLDVLPTNGIDLSFSDVSDFDSVRQAMQGIEVLYHLAATTNGDWASYYYGTVVGTRNVLQAATEEGVKKVVYVSSLGVLHASNFPRGGMIDENFPLEQKPEARGAYSRAKLEAEQVALKFAKDGGLPICIVRPGIVYGMDSSKFLPDAGFCVSDNIVLVIGMGRRLLGLTYVENLVDALLLAAQSQNSCGKIYHIVDYDQPTVQQYIRDYRRSTGQRLIPFYIPTFFWTTGFGFIDRLLGFVRGSSPNLEYRLRSIARGPRYDTTAVQEELGWKGQVSFETGIQRTFKS